MEPRPRVKSLLVIQSDQNSTACSSEHPVRSTSQDLNSCIALFLVDFQEHYILSDCWPVLIPSVETGQMKAIICESGLRSHIRWLITTFVFKLGNVPSWWSLHRQGGDLVKLLLTPHHFLQRLHRMFTPRWLTGRIRKRYAIPDPAASQISLAGLAHVHKTC